MRFLRGFVFVGWDPDVTWVPLVTLLFSCGSHFAQVPVAAPGVHLMMIDDTGWGTQIPCIVSPDVSAPSPKPICLY